MSFDRRLARPALLLLGAASFALAGCNSIQKHIGEEDPAFGEAVKYDTALQTVNPDPVYGPNSAKPGDNGDKGARAVKRYRTDAVKAVQTSDTQSAASGAGTGMSSSPSH